MAQKNLGETIAEKSNDDEQMIETQNAVKRKSTDTIEGPTKKTKRYIIIT